MIRILFLSFALFVLSHAQAGDLRKIKKLYEKGEWQKTEEAIRKSLEKTPINPGAKYYYSLLYFNEQFARQHLDSARIWVRAALADLETAPQDVRDELSDEQLAEGDFIAHLQAIDERWFAVAKSNASVDAYQQYLDYFPEGVHVQAATQSRDELAFKKVTATLSENQLRQFMANYPSSHLYQKAKNKLDSLIVLTHQQAASVAELEKFVAENEGSQYYDKALWSLLSLKTVDGNPQKFLHFIRKYPNTPAGQWAIECLFHLDRASGFSLAAEYLDFHVKSDSLRDEMSQTLYFPVFSQTYRLQSVNGQIHTPFTTLDEAIICNGLDSDILAGQINGKPTIINRQGKFVANGTLAKDLGVGYLLVRAANGSHNIVHKTGKILLTNVDDAELLNQTFLKVKRNKWALFSLLGEALTDFLYDDIFTKGEFWFFEKSDLIATATPGELVSAFPNGLFLEFKYDDYELVNDRLLIGFRDDRECLITSEGKFIVPWGKQHIYPSETQGFIRDERGYAVYGGMNYYYFPYIEMNNGYVLRKEGPQKWLLTSARNNWITPVEDSVKLINDYAALIVGEQPKLVFQNQTQVALSAQDMPTLFSPNLPYVLVSGSLKTVYDGAGAKILSGNYSEIKVLGDSLFAVSFKGKYGLIDAKGREIFKPEYEFIGYENGLIGTLRKGKIGGYDPVRKVSLEPMFDAKPERIGQYYKVIVGGKAGLLDASLTKVLPCQYDNIFSWTNQQVWLQTGELFQLFDLSTGEGILDVTLLSALHPLVPDLRKFYSSTGFGVLGKKGIIVPAGFTDVRYIGNETDGYVLAEQHLSEADYHVLTYYTLTGEKIFSQAYRSADYEKVFCDD